MPSVEAVKVNQPRSIAGLDSMTLEGQPEVDAVDLEVSEPEVTIAEVTETDVKEPELKTSLSGERKHESNGMEKAPSPSPKEALEPEESKGLTSMETTLSVMTCVIGAGVMALPQLPTKGGWFLSAVFLALGAYAVLEAGLTFHKAASAYNIDKAPEDQIRSYIDFAKVGSRPRFQALAMNAVRICLIVQNTGAGIGYMILMGDQVSSIVMGNIDPKMIRLIMCPIMIGMSLLRDVTAVAKLVPIALTCACLCCGIIVLQSQSDKMGWQNWPLEARLDLHLTWPENMMGLGTVIATQVGAFATMSNVPQIFSEMRDQSEFPKAFRLAMAACGGLYFAVMWFGYQGYGQFILSNVVDNMEYTPESPEQAFNCDWYYKDWTGVVYFMEAEMAAACVVINLMISMPLLLMCVFNAIVSLCPETLATGTCKNYVMRVSLVLLITAVAIVVPNFGAVFSLIGAVVSPWLNLIFPFVFAYVIRKKSHSQESWGRLLLHACILLLAGFCIVVGFTDSMNALMDTSTACHYDPTTTPGCGGKECSPHLSVTHGRTSSSQVKSPTIDFTSDVLSAVP